MYRHAETSFKIFCSLVHLRTLRRSFCFWDASIDSIHSFQSIWTWSQYFVCRRPGSEILSQGRRTAGRRHPLRNAFAFLVSVPSFLVLTSPIFLARCEGEGYRVTGRRETNAKIVEELNFPACANAKMESWSLD